MRFHAYDRPGGAVSARAQPDAELDSPRAVCAWLDRRFREALGLSEDHSLDLTEVWPSWESRAQRGEPVTVNVGVRALLVVPAP